MKKKEGDRPNEVVGAKNISHMGKAVGGGGGIRLEALLIGKGEVL